LYGLITLHVIATQGIIIWINFPTSVIPTITCWWIQAVRGHLHGPWVPAFLIYFSTAQPHHMLL
jgi:hypothetical protein